MAGDSFDVASNNTLDRREMQCPRCFEYRLEQDPDVAREFSGKRDKTIFATRCANEACPVDRVDPEDIRKQTPSQNFFQRVSADYGMLATLILVVVVGAVVLTGLAISGIVGPDDPAEITVELVEDGIHPVENVEVRLDGETLTTDSSGRVTFDEKDPGESFELDIRPGPESPYATPVTTEITITDGAFIAENPHWQIDRLGSEEMRLHLTEPYVLTETTRGASEDVTVPFATAVNAERGVDVTLHGVETMSARQAVTLESGSENDVELTLAGEATDQKLAISAPLTGITVEDSDTYTSTTSVSLDGDHQSDIVLDVDPVGGAYPSVEIDGNEVCSSDDLAQTSGACSLADRGADDDRVMTLSMSGVDANVNYTLSYTAMAASESVTVLVNGDRHRVTPTDDEVNTDGTWETQVALEDLTTLETGANTVGIRASTTNGVETAVTGEVTYELVDGVPTEPTVRVEDAEGEVHQRTVPEEYLSDSGVLVETYELTVDPTWFADGENTVGVRTESGAVQMDVRAEIGVAPADNDGE